MVISTSLQACGAVFPFAIPTSICRSNVTICSALYLLMDMTSLPPRKRFSLTSASTKIPGQVAIDVYTHVADEYDVRVAGELDGILHPLAPKNENGSEV